MSTRDVAEKAKVTEGSIYRLFSSKDGLFEEALTTVLRQLMEPAQLLMMIYENEDQPDRVGALTAALLRWYSSLTPSAARLLVQAYFMEQWRDLAYAPINKIMAILAKTLQRETGAGRSSPEDCAIAA